MAPPGLRRAAEGGLGLGGAPTASNGARDPSPHNSRKRSVGDRGACVPAAATLLPQVLLGRPWPSLATGCPDPGALFNRRGVRTRALRMRTGREEERGLGPLPPAARDGPARGRGGAGETPCRRAANQSRRPASPTCGALREVGRWLEGRGLLCRQEISLPTRRFSVVSQELGRFVPSCWSGLLSEASRAPSWSQSLPPPTSSMGMSSKEIWGDGDRRTHGPNSKLALFSCWPFTLVFCLS
jgi:hypothetical protein